MSSFNFPENIHDSFSTQFSFDESIIAPTLLSPSLSNRNSGSSYTSKKRTLSMHQDEVVEAVSVMKNGCFMIMLKLPKFGVDLNKKVKIPPIQWNICNLDDKLENITILSSNSSQIKLPDVSNINKLHRESAIRVQSALSIDGIEQIGLQSVTLQLTMKQNSIHYGYDWYLIFDEYKTAFIWNKGLRIISSTIHSVSTIPVIVTNIDRINNNEMHKKMQINNNKNSNDDTEKWINHIAKKIKYINKNIQRLHSFAAQSCILGSSDHLTFMIQTNSLKDIFDDLQKLINIPYYQLNKNEIISIRELWLSLVADLTVAILKENQLKNDMKLSRASRNKFKPNKLFFLSK